MKIGVVGLGYWGKILLKNLELLHKSNISVCDSTLSESEHLLSYEIINDYKKIDCDYIFIATPTGSHFEICKYFLEKNTNIFCEKPLTTSISEAEQLYGIAEKNDLILFTDWIFTFNNHIEIVKRDYLNGKLGKIKSIFMNRLNLGPERYDVNARWDLAAHDVSIIQYLFSEFPVKVSWKDFRRNKDSKQCDSSLGLINYEDFNAIINVSWQYRKKVRECVFEFENYFIVWDDYKRFLQYEDSKNINFPIYSGNISYPCGNYQEPLKNSINAFFSFTQHEMLQQKIITLDTIKILEL